MKKRIARFSSSTLYETLVPSASLYILSQAFSLYNMKCGCRDSEIETWEDWCEMGLSWAVFDVGRPCRLKVTTIGSPSLSESVSAMLFMQPPYLPIASQQWL